MRDGELPLEEVFASEVARVHLESLAKPRNALARTFALLDAVAAGARNTSKRLIELPLHAQRKAALLRLGSIAAHATQIDAYTRIAADASVICEVGFNLGHSTAVWLHANNHSVVHSFDLWPARSPSSRALALLRASFPGRLHPYRGDSLVTLASVQIEPACDLVHIDGRHAYLHTVADTLHLMRHAQPGALWLFDDQCDPRACDAASIVAGEPTLATCDLERSRLLERVTTPSVAAKVATTPSPASEGASATTRAKRTMEVGGGGAARREFAMFRAARGAAIDVISQHRAAFARGAAPPPGSLALLACVPPCRVEWSSVHAERRWQAYLESVGRAPEQWQQAMRPPSCVFG